MKYCLGARRKWAAFFLAAVLFLAGCRGEAAGEAQGEAIEAAWTRGQVMTVVATERNRYQNVYTEQIWSAASGIGERDFEDELMEQIRTFFTELTLIGAMAKEEQLELSGRETDALNRLAGECFAQLSGGDREFLQVTQQEIYDLYEAYHRANRMVEEMTGQEDLEVSDAQAKVIHVQQIITHDRVLAEDALAAALQEGADFGALARQYSDGDTGEITMERSQQPDALEEAAFALEQDQVSGIVEQEGAYYILKCVDAYDEEATAVRKAQMEEEKRSQVFQRIYEPFAATHQVNYPDGFWDGISFAGGESCRTDNFFEMYGEYFGDSR